MPETPFVINFNLVLQNFGDDLELLISTVELSLKLIPQHVEKIHLAIKEKNAKNLEISAHTLKGSLGIYQYAPLTNLAFELEKMGRNLSFDLAPETLKTLEQQLICFYENLESFSHTKAVSS